MDVCHILLGRPWKYDREAIHEGQTNCLKFEKDGIRHTLLPLQEEKINGASSSKTLLLSGKEYLQQMEEEEVSFSILASQK